MEGILRQLLVHQYRREQPPYFPVQNFGEESGAGSSGIADKQVALPFGVTAELRKKRKNDANKDKNKSKQADPIRSKTNEQAASGTNSFTVLGQVLSFGLARA